MSNNSETLARLNNNTSETNVTSRLQEIIRKAKRILGRHALVLTLATTSAATINVGEAAIIPTSAEAATFLQDYPNPDAQCEFGAGIGASCTNPNDSNDKYDWYIDEDGNGVYTSSDELWSSRGYGYRNCTDGVAWWVSHNLPGYSVPSYWNNANSWDNNAPSNEVLPGNTNSIEPGDIAQSDDGSFGHVGFVVSVSKNTNGSVTSIKTAEMNKLGDGNYTGPDVNIYSSKNTSNKFIRSGSWDWDHFIDVNGLGKGLNNESLSGGAVSSMGRIAFINSLNAGFAKDEIVQGGWHTLTGNGDAQVISAAGTHLAVITGGGRAAGADVTADKLKTNSPGLMDLNVPLNPNYPGGVKYIDIDDHGDMIAINNCNAAYGWRNDPGQLRWVQLTGCGDAQKVSVGNRRFGLVNACGGAYNSDTGYAWTQDLPCGNAKDIAIGETQRIMVLTRDNTAYIYDPGSNSWINKTPVGDAQNIAIGKDRIMVVTSGGAAWAADVGQDARAPMTRLTSDGDASAIAVGAHDRMALINGAGAAFASDEIIANGKWTQESGNGDAKSIAVG
jgi:surface antigen